MIQPNVLIGLLILVTFLIAAAIMFTRKLPALIVLPGMGLLIVAGTALIISLFRYLGAQSESGALSGLASLLSNVLNLEQVPPPISVRDITEGVISKGAIRLHEPIIIAFFGGILSFIMQKSGVAENLVKNAAELIGDNPFMVAVFSLGLIAVLFTSIGGLGAIIMVAMVVLPMMATVGVQPPVAGGILLFGISLGGILNPGNWVVYTSVLGLQKDSVQSFAILVFLLTALAGVYFITIELWRGGTLKSFAATGGILLSLTVVAVMIVGALVLTTRSAEKARSEERLAAEKQALVEKAGGAVAAVTGASATEEPKVTIGMQIKRGFQVVFALFFAYIIVTHLLDIRKRIRRWRHQIVKIEWYTYLIPLVPLVLILVYDMPILAAFLTGFLYAVFVTVRPGFISLSIQSMIQGASSVLPASLLMIGIGIVLNSVLGPSNYSANNDGAKWPVLAAIEPLFNAIIPDSIFGYVILFGLAAPLALYRGPLNVWGLGYGVTALLLASMQLPPEAIMAMLLVVGQVQGICDPTNTHNVWLANELRVDVQTLMWRTIPYVWAMVFVGLSVAGIIYAPKWEELATKRAAAATVETKIDLKVEAAK